MYYNYTQTVCVILYVLQCLVIGEITCEKMVVALNKIDQIDEAKREKEIAKVNATIYCYY